MAMQESFRAACKAALPGVAIDWGWNLQGVRGVRVTLNMASGSDGVAHDGATGLIQRRVQVDLFAPTFKAARDAADALRLALHGARPAPIVGIFLAGYRDLPPDTTAGETLARISLDFFVHYQE